MAAFGSVSSPGGSEETDILQLPVEILEKIFLYLDPDFLYYHVRLVCKRFCSILTDEAIWKRHFLLMSKSLSKSSNPYPVLEHMGLYSKQWKCGLDLLWRDMAVQFTTDMKRWVLTQNFLSERLIEPHYASVDTVHLLNDAEFCISGGRDRLLVVWDVERMKSVTFYEKSHGGWIWDVDSYERDFFFSCGWDSHVFMWNLSPSVLRPIQSFRCENPAMTLACKRGLVATGLLHIPRIVLIDPRMQLVNYKSTVQLHKGAITDLNMIDNTLISVSEDKTMAVYDLRMHKTIVKNIYISVEDSFPRSIGVCHNMIYVGDTRGNIHVYDANENYTKVQVIELGVDAKQITTVCARRGSLIVSSTDMNIRFIVPSDPAVTVKEFEFCGEVTSIDYKHNILAVAGTDHSVTLLRGVKHTSSISRSEK